MSTRRRSGSSARGAAVATCALLAFRAASAQVPTSGRHNADLSGVWTNVNAPGTDAWAINTFSEQLPRLTAWGQAKFDAAKPQRGPRGVPVNEMDDLVYKCYPPGTPRRYYRKTDWTIEEFVCEDNATYEEYEKNLLEFDAEAE